MSAEKNLKFSKLLFEVRDEINYLYASLKSRRPSIMMTFPHKENLELIHQFHMDRPRINLIPSISLGKLGTCTEKFRERQLDGFVPTECEHSSEWTLYFDNRDKDHAQRIYESFIARDVMTTIEQLKERQVIIELAKAYLETIPQIHL